MQRKKEYLVSISTLAMMLMLGSLSPAAEKDNTSTGVEKMISISEKTTDIKLELQGNSNIIFVETDNVFGVRNLKYSGTQNNPVAVEQTGNTIRLVQKSRHKSWFKSDPTMVSYELLLPKNRKVHITADQAVFTGFITASDLRINSGNLNIDEMTVQAADKVKITGGVARINMKINRCAGLKLVLGNVSGEITLPETASVFNTSGVSMLSINRAPAGSGKDAKKSSWRHGMPSGNFITSRHPGMFCGWPVHVCE